MKKLNVLFLAFIYLGLPGLFIYPQSAREGASMSNSGTAQNSTNQNSGNQNSSESTLPLKRIALLSSGVGYFEHSGTLSSPAEIALPFDAASVDDALKSLVVNDPASNSPSVRYASENTLYLTLKSLKIDLSGTPGIGDILNGLKGAELEVSAPNAIKGRIIGVEYRQSPVSQQYGYPRSADEAWLSLFTSQGIRVIAVKDIASFRFTDTQINADLNRALDLIMASRDESARNLLVTLNGTGSRDVSLSYVIPTPVWKVSYRLDISGKEPFLQGWAIVDNDSDADWNGVELSLVTGRPVSFIQRLYPPYRLSRPVVPLAIAGFAESRTYESGYEENERRAPVPAPSAMMRTQSMADTSAKAEMDYYYGQQEAPAVGSVAGGAIETASGRAAGDQFEFTLKNPVTLDRRQSAMLPLVEGAIKAEKVLVFSGSRASGGATINPAISAELVNTSGMKLPAGPITVYDGGTYAGDALIEFFPENEKRLISYGEDLSVSGNVASSGTRYITAVNISSGVMTITRRQSYEKVYTIKNASGQAKKIIIEHPITSGSELMEPASADDRTGSLYRFNRNLPPNETFTFKVREETPVLERITLAQLRADTFLSYASNQEIPADVRTALTRAIELKRTADNAAAAQSTLETQKSRLISDQDRVRRNLEAAGNQTPQGQEYLKRMAALDDEIDAINKQIETAVQEAQRAKAEYDSYLATIKI